MKAKRFSINKIYTNINLCEILKLHFVKEITNKFGLDGFWENA